MGHVTWKRGRSNDSWTEAGRGCCGPGQRRAAVASVRREQHLYLVLDDWRSGYSIRKVSIEPPSLSGGSGEGSTMASIRTTGDGTLQPCPVFMCSKEKVFNEKPAERRHVSATLLHMRPGRFCLVECVSIDDNGRADQEISREPGADGGGCFVYRLKTFSLGYDAKRELKLKNCRVRCYSLPQEVTSGFLDQDPAAFWL